jgi:hypothetical protein
MGNFWVFGKRENFRGFYDIGIKVDGFYFESFYLIYDLALNVLNLIKC